jgi:hypothetical protein
MEHSKNNRTKSKVEDKRVKDFCKGLEQLTKDTGLQLKGKENMIVHLVTPEGVVYEVALFEVGNDIKYGSRPLE